MIIKSALFFLLFALLAASSCGAPSQTSSSNSIATTSTMTTTTTIDLNGSIQGDLFLKSQDLLRLRSFDVQTGLFQFEITLDSTNSVPVYTYGRIFIADISTDSIKAYSMIDGSLLWQSTLTTKSINGPIVGYGGQLYASETPTGQVFDGSDGTFKFNLPFDASSSFFLSQDHYSITNATTGVINVYDISTGGLLWTDSTDGLGLNGTINLIPSLINGNYYGSVVDASGNYFIKAVNGSNGAVLFTTAVLPKPDSMLFNIKPLAALTSNTIISMVYNLTGLNFKVSGYSQIDGSLQWSRTLGINFPSAVMVSAGTHAVISYFSTIPTPSNHLISMDSAGNVLFNTTFSSLAGTSPGKIFLITDDKLSVKCLSLNSSSPLWTRSLATLDATNAVPMIIFSEDTQYR